MMKTLLLFLLLIMTSIINGCGGCSDCGPIGLAKYGLVNTFDKTLELEFYGTKLSSRNYGQDFFELDLQPIDTSKIWVVLPEPVGYTAFEYVFTTGITNDYFSLETDSVLIRIDNSLVKTFRRRSDELAQDYQSIFYWGAYELSNGGGLFYKLDSVNLDLK